MAIDQIDDSLLNELRIGSVQTPNEPVDPNSQQLPISVGQIGGSASQSIQQMPSAPKQRPTFMSAFLANLGPALAGGMARASGKGGFAGGIAQGAGGAAEGIIGEQHYQQQVGMQAEELKAKTEFQKAQAASLTPSIPMQDANGNTVMMPPAHVGQAFSAGYRFAATTQSANTRAGAQLGVQGMKSQTATDVQGMKGDLATKLQAQSIREKVREFNATDDYKRWKAKLDYDKAIRVADLTQNRAPAQILQTAVFANGGISQLDKAKPLMDDLEKRGLMGTIPANKMEDYIFGKGLADPTWDSQTRYEMGELRAALGYTSSAAMRAHTGRTSSDIYQDFKSRLGAGQDWSALRGAMDETRGLLEDYRDAASSANIRNLRSGGGATPTTPTAPTNKLDVDALIQSVLGNKKNATKPAGK